MIIDRTTPTGDIPSSSTTDQTAIGSEKQENSNGQGKEDDYYWYEPPPTVRAPLGAQHGKGGVFYGGNWVDIEDCDGTFHPAGCKDCPSRNDCSTAARSSSSTQVRSASSNAKSDSNTIYDVVIIGAGCIGGSVARELSKLELKVLWLEAADDVSQGATKGNSGIVHAGYDDKPGSNRAKYCWKGNQMFAQLDRELRFGYQKNGSLVVAFSEADMEHLKILEERGRTNGVKFLRIVGQAELRRMEPHISPDAIGALYAPEAGNVIPYVSSAYLMWFIRTAD